VRAVSLARKLNTIEGRIQDQSCLSQRGSYRSKEYNPEKFFVWKRKLQKESPVSRKTVLGLIPGRSVFCGSETKHDRRMMPRKKLFISKRL
jgi:hypothetical protein